MVVRVMRRQTKANHDLETCRHLRPSPSFFRWGLGHPTPGERSLPLFPCIPTPAPKREQRKKGEEFTHKNPGARTLRKCVVCGHQ